MCELQIQKIQVRNLERGLTSPREQTKAKREQLIEENTVEGTHQEYQRRNRIPRRRCRSVTMRFVDTSEGQVHLIVAYDAGSDPVGEYGTLMKEDEETEKKKKRKKKQKHIPMGRALVIDPCVKTLKGKGSERKTNHEVLSDMISCRCVGRVRGLHRGRT